MTDQEIFDGLCKLAKGMSGLHPLAGINFDEDEEDKPLCCSNCCEELSEDFFFLEGWHGYFCSEECCNNFYSFAVKQVSVDG